jgi:hypothetical protein
MRVGKQALAHAHGQEGNAGLFDKGFDRVVGLRIGRALAEDDQRPLGALQNRECTLDRFGRRNLRRRRIDYFDERFAAGFRIHHLAEQFRGRSR